MVEFLVYSGVFLTGISIIVLAVFTACRKMRRQRDCLHKYFYYDVYEKMPADLVEVLDEIEGRRPIPGLRPPLSQMFSEVKETSYSLLEKIKKAVAKQEERYDERQ